MYRVCVVEDDPFSQELLVHAMQGCKRLALAGAYATGEEALKELPKVNPDVVLMDIKLPGMSGIECLAALRHLSPPSLCPVLILTEYADNALIFAALKAGAAGYLLKRHAAGKALQRAITETMAGGGPMSPSIAHRVIESFHRLPEGTAHAGMTDQLGSLLTKREWEVLRCLTGGKPYKQIADGLHISPNTVHRHVKNLCCKLHVQTRCDPRLYSVMRQHDNPPY